MPPILVRGSCYGLCSAQQCGSRYCSSNVNSCARLNQLELVVLVLEADLVQRRDVNCTATSDGQGCGEIV